MIDSPILEERLKGLVGISCHACLDQGYEQEFKEGIGWVMLMEEDNMKDGDGKPVRRMKKCNHGKIEDFGY
jgi:hypothetical protein